jgi:hypothetical protein
LNTADIGIFVWGRFVALLDSWTIRVDDDLIGLCALHDVLTFSSEAFAQVADEAVSAVSMALSSITPAELESSEGPTELVRLYVQMQNQAGQALKGRVVSWDGPNCGYTVRLLGKRQFVHGVSAVDMMFLDNQEEVESRNASREDVPIAHIGGSVPRRGDAVRSRAAMYGRRTASEASARRHGSLGHILQPRRLRGSAAFDRMAI